MDGQRTTAKTALTHSSRGKKQQTIDDDGFCVGDIGCARSLVDFLYRRTLTILHADPAVFRGTVYAVVHIRPAGAIRR